MDKWVVPAWMRILPSKMWTISPPRAARRHPVHRVRGFTLIEILVVMFIIAVVSGIALLSLGVLGKDAGLQAEAEQLTQTITLLSERAGLEGCDYGLLIAPDGFWVMRLNPDSGLWELVDNDWRIKAHRYGAGTEASLALNGHPIPLVSLSADELKRMPRVGDSSKPTEAIASNARVLDDSEGRDERFNKAFDRTDHSWANHPPQIWILASGELTPFHWQLKLSLIHI